MPGRIIRGTEWGGSGSVDGITSPVFLSHRNRGTEPVIVIPNRSDSRPHEPLCASGTDDFASQRRASCPAIRPVGTQEVIACRFARGRSAEARSHGLIGQFIGAPKQSTASVP